MRKFYELNFWIPESFLHQESRLAPRAAKERHGNVKIFWRRPFQTVLFSELTGRGIGGLTAVDRNVEGVVEMMLDATQCYAEPLSGDRLFGSHAALFPTARSGMTKINVGTWRDDKSGPMQVVSGPMGKEKVHYEAPGAAPAIRRLRWLEAERKHGRQGPQMREQEARTTKTPARALPAQCSLGR
jgi:hypothetical protein